MPHTLGMTLHGIPFFSSQDVICDGIGASDIARDLAQKDGHALEPNAPNAETWVRSSSMSSVISFDSEWMNSSDIRSDSTSDTSSSSDGISPERKDPDRTRDAYPAIYPSRISNSEHQPASSSNRGYTGKDIDRNAARACSNLFD